MSRAGGAFGRSRLSWPLARLAVLASGSVVVGCAGAHGADLLHPEAATGWRYARMECGRCHAVEPAAASPNPHAPPFAEIARGYDDYALDLEFEALARVGHFEMPPRVIPSAERKALTAYLLRLRSRQAD